MLTNTNTLSQFVVRGQDGSYDNEYNDALIATERREAITEAARQLLNGLTTQSLDLAKTIGRGALNGLDEFLTSLD
jgi:hypothetical protein